MNKKELMAIPTEGVPETEIPYKTEVYVEPWCKGGKGHYNTVTNYVYTAQSLESGVLMLNTVLTVRRGQANSHKGKGWEIFTDHVIGKLNEREKPIVFLLWGGNAKAKRALITNPNHLVLMAAHPSPLSAYNGFFGCRHFSKCNDFLISHGIEPVDWRIE